MANKTTLSSWWKELPLALVYPNAASFDDLPRELVSNILSRLPVKTLVQSTSVSKLWYSLIKNPSFLKSHLTSSISKLTDNYILITPKSYSNDPVLSFFADDNDYSFVSNVKIPFQTRSKTINIVGSCNGLVCFTDYVDAAYGGDVYLFNPLINKLRMLRSEYSCYCDWMEKNFSVYPVLGFGFCESQNDFRVVRILYSAHHVEKKLRPRVEVYSLKSGKWRSVKAKIDHLMFRGCNAFVDGCLYWVACVRARERVSWVMWFDLKDEVFREVEMPEGYDKNGWGDNWPVNIMYWNGEVAVGAMEPAGYGNYLKCGFWVLKKDDGGEMLWKKKFKLVLQDQLCGLPIGFTLSGKVVIDALDNEDTSRRKSNAELTKTAALNLDDLKFKDLAVDGPHTVATCFQESLALFLE
ncbi:hypothetical protein ACH5RR_022845 [Cinchona calisaya]|uniref:F-box domain-containing protein n=1 Tax=Cinchona calisaya TaxID=153742 RepID=A0ABD2ZDY0_9GENT